MGAFQNREPGASEMPDLSVACLQSPSALSTFLYSFSHLASGQQESIPERSFRHLNHLSALDMEILIAHVHDLIGAVAPASQLRFVAETLAFAEKLSLQARNKDFLSEGQELIGECLKKALALGNDELIAHASDDVRLISNILKQSDVDAALTFSESAFSQLHQAGHLAQWGHLVDLLTLYRCKEMVLELREGLDMLSDIPSQSVSTEVRNGAECWLSIMREFISSSARR